MREEITYLLCVAKAPEMIPSIQHYEQWLLAHEWTGEYEEFPMPAWSPCKWCVRLCQHVVSPYQQIPLRQFAEEDLDTYFKVRV